MILSFLKLLYTNKLRENYKDKTVCIKVLISGNGFAFDSVGPFKLVRNFTLNTIFIFLNNQM